MHPGTVGRLPQADCQSCGAPTATGQNYCISCGGRLADPAALTRAGAAAAETEVAGDTSAAKGGVSAVAAGSRLPPWIAWAALPLNDRRWAAPLAAIALGFGIFAGIAIGPGASGTFAGAAQVIKLPASLFAGDGGGSSSPADSSASSVPPASELAGPVGNVSSGGGGSTVPVAPPVTPLPSPPAPAPAPAPAPTPTSRPNPNPGDNQNDDQENKPPPKPETASGTVIHTNPAAQSYTLAAPDGQATVIHASKLPSPTTKLEVPIRLLANGTYAEDGGRTEEGHTGTAKLTGFVTFVDPAAGVYSVSRRAVSALIHVAADGSAAPKVPLLGANATVDVRIRKTSQAATQRPRSRTGRVAHGTGSGGLFSLLSAIASAASSADPQPSPGGCSADPATPPEPITATAELWQKQLKTSGDPSTYSDFAGITEAVCPGSHQISVSADDIRESDQDLMFTVPKDIDLRPFKAGRSIALTSLIGADGSLSLTGIARDDGVTGADDSSAAQGDLAG